MNKIVVETVRNVLWPLGRRVGTAAAALLVAHGWADESHAVQLAQAVGVVGAIGFDLVAAYVYKKKRLT